VFKHFPDLFALK